MIIGVDVGSRLKNAGVAVGRLQTGKAHIEEVAAGATEALMGRGADSAIEPVVDWICARVPSEGPVLIAIDAPLGWPQSLSAGLAAHRAGEAIPAPDGPARLWRRATDVDIHARFGKLPLEVGANYIARTAWVALEILSGVRQQVGREIPVILSPEEEGAIETYPAATLRAVLGRPPGRYKAREPTEREGLLSALGAVLTMTDEARATALAVDHAFDAAICVLAGADFLMGRVPDVPTETREAARREGWIHVRDAS